MAFTVTLTRGNFHRTLPNKTKILIKDFTKLSLCKHVTTDSEVPERLVASSKSKVQWKLPRVTVTVTVKVTEVNMQSP